MPIYSTTELLGTKLRALYQRRKGRDLFDLWQAHQAGVLDAPAVADAFAHSLANPVANARPLVLVVPDLKADLGSIGGPAARLAQDNIRKVEVLEYPELGMEAIWRIEVEDFPAFVVVDDKGNDFFAETLRPVTLNIPVGPPK